LPPAPDPATPAAPSVRTGQRSVRVLLLLVALAAVVYGLDQLVKTVIVADFELGEVRPFLGEIVQLHYVLNPGAAFSLASGFTWILSIVAVGVITAIVWLSRRIRSAGWATMFGLVLGGALGNLTDRFVRPPGFPEGHVVDYIQLIYFPAIFNIADIAIVTSMCLFVLLTIRGVRLDGTRHVQPPRGAQDAGDEHAADQPAADAPAADAPAADARGERRAEDR
jgi:signal peptidase II